MGESLQVEPRVAQKNQESIQVMSEIRPARRSCRWWMWLRGLRGLYWEGCRWELLSKGDAIRFGSGVQSRWASRKPERA